ncbi:hypothetical protein BHT95_13840 [Bacillus paralicheniformis]|nr:hypothetical protein BHT95_13840 [Bacillus paralicheniformis]
MEVQVLSAASQKYQGFNHLWYYWDAENTETNEYASIFSTKKVLTSAQNCCASLHFYSQDTLPVIIDYAEFI